MKRLKFGNKKLSSCIAVFDLPTSVCLNNKLCRDKCYAKKAERIYPNVRKWRNDNLKYSKLDSFPEIISRQITSSKVKIVRIHSSGDFYSDEYVRKWAEIAKNNHDVIFYCYTKCLGKLNFDPLLSLHNVNVIGSLIDGKCNFGSIEYVAGLAKDNKGAVICPATMADGVRGGLS